MTITIILTLITGGGGGGGGGAQIIKGGTYRKEVCCIDEFISNGDVLTEALTEVFLCHFGFQKARVSISKTMAGTALVSPPDKENVPLVSECHSLQGEANGLTDEST